jgi:hypothetical protein
MSVLHNALADGRREHEALMEDRVRIHRPGPTTFNQATGADTPGADLVLYEGPARVKAIGLARGREAVAGEREIALRSYEVAVPWSTTVPPGQVIQPGDQVLILSSTDPRVAAPGVNLWVNGDQFSATATAWRIYAEDREARNDH